MAKQYRVGEFLIDLSRNQISRNHQSQVLAPKVLAVLTCLAERQGHVVSQDELMSKVWSGSIVSPNTLQRCVAQLRKSLGDDGKEQLYIKTHAKQGYSLECEVRWVDSLSPSDDGLMKKEAVTIKQGTPVRKPQFNKSKQAGFLVFAVVGVLVWALFQLGHVTPESSRSPSFGAIHSLTATDDKEFDATYSPDGQYVVFHRYLDQQCANRIWAKNTETQKEIQLTSDWGSYGSHDFSPDGQQLVFFAGKACDTPITRLDCYDLVSLDFEKALQSPQQPRILLQCKQSKAVKPTWVSENNIVMLQLQSNRVKLINYSIKDNRSTELYHPNEGRIIDFDYSSQRKLLAVSRILNDGSQYIELLDIHGNLRSSHPIQRPAEIPKFHLIRPSFDPENDQLIFSTGRQLFSLSFEGQVNKINLPLADRLVQPEYHPEGQRLLMIKESHDSDIVKLNFSDLNGQTANQYPSFDRSIQGEGQARFQPNGSLIAYWSERSGEQQLWLSTGHERQQLTSFPVDTSIRGFEWASDGQSLLVNANGFLTRVGLDGEQEPISIKRPVLQLFHWDSDKDNVLILGRVSGMIQLMEYDLNANSHQVITVNKVRWAQKSADGEVVFKDNLDQFWRPGAIDPIHIETLDKQGDRVESFVIVGNTIYAINNRNQLWSFDLDDHEFEILGEVLQSVDRLTDVSNQQLLMTVHVASKNEVVELLVDEE